MGVSIVMGVPKNGWFFLGKIPSRNGWFGGTPISGNLHISTCCIGQTHKSETCYAGLLCLDWNDPASMVKACRPITCDAFGQKLGDWSWKAQKLQVYGLTKMGMKVSLAFKWLKPTKTWLMWWTTKTHRDVASHEKVASPSPCRCTTW